MKVELFSICDRGLERPNNEDAIAICSDVLDLKWDSLNTHGYIVPSHLGSLIIVADGMGGANAGEVASALAIEGIKRHYEDKDRVQSIKSDTDFHNFMREGILKSNQDILTYSQEHPETEGMGTTFVLLWLIGNKAYIAWCGDSRCYCFNPKAGLKLLTKDHSYVQELIDKGKITFKEAINHPDSNLVTRCLGDADVDSEPEFMTYDIQDGDIFLSCSDGLCGYCTNSSIERAMYAYYNNIEKCTNSLFQMALKTGGQDNISIVVCSTLPENSNSVKVGIIGYIKHLISKLFL